MPRALAALAVALLAASPARAAVVPAAPAEQVPAPSLPAVPPELAQAVDALKRGDAAAALRSATAFVKKNPRSAVGQEVLGVAALMAYDYKGAELALAEAVRLEPGRATAMLWLAQVGLRTGDLRKA